MRTTYTKLPAKKSTWQRFEAIRREKKWTLTTTVEEAVEALAAREQIRLPNPPRNRSKRTADSEAA